jgi:hypothetical protein
MVRGSLERSGVTVHAPHQDHQAGAQEPLTRDGLLFAHFYTKVYDHVLRSLMAPDRPNAPPELLAALDTLDQAAVSHITSARIPAAA